MEKMEFKVNSCPVFVSSADSYSDIWIPFFQIFKREWPEYSGTIYLNTQELDFKFEGLKIVCTKVGHKKYFGETFFAGLDQLQGDHFLLLMVDYFFERKVDVAMLDGIYSDFCAQCPDSVCLMPYPFKNLEPISGVTTCRRICPPGERAWFSFQAAFWQKDSIRKFIRGWESPWQAESYGCKRAEIVNPDIWSVSENPMPYDPAGVLHGGGKWYESALAKINLTGIDLQRGKRGVYSRVALSRAARMKWLVRNLFSIMRSRLSLIGLEN